MLCLAPAAVRDDDTLLLGQVADRARPCVVRQLRHGPDFGQFHGPGLDAAVATAGGGVSGRDLWPGQGP